MKMKFKGLKKKCIDEKYFEAIKYMSHTLTGSVRTSFIKIICQYNIYLGAMCATTCEYDQKLDHYIKTNLNRFFDKKQVSYYDKKTGQNYTYTKVPGKKDIERFMLASYEIGNFKAIKWVIHNYVININTLIKVAQRVSEAELVDLFSAISKSINQDKMGTICRVRTIPTQKNNEHAQRLLKFYWYENKQIFTYLADSFGWLSDLGSRCKYGERIYAKCFEGAENSIAFNDMVINALDVNYQKGLERLFKIIADYASEEVKKNLYMLFYMKLQHRFPIYKTDYKVLGNVQTIDKREQYLGMKILRGIVRENCSSWINVFDLIYYFPQRSDIDITTSSGEVSRNVYPMNRYLEHYPDTSLKKVIYTYFKSEYVSRIYLDDFVMLVASCYNVRINDICNALNDFNDIGHVFQRGSLSYFKHKWKTLKYPVTTEKVQLGEKYQILYEDYDYIGHRFHVSVKNTVIFETNKDK